MRTIELTQGKVALVDDEDYDHLSQWSWAAVWTGFKFYARANIGGKNVYMHRLLVGEPGLHVDHRDGDGLNNQRLNLRPATNGQNMANMGKPSHNTSGFKGVHLFKRTKRWQAKIQVNGKQPNLGYFSTAEEAAKAYDEAALKYFGEFACLNFPKAA